MSERNETSTAIFGNHFEDNFMNKINEIYINLSMQIKYAQNALKINVCINKLIF